MALALALGVPSALAQRPVGIDVSHWQGTITWSSVKSAGIAFAWAKATEGGTNHYADPNYVANQTGAKSAGVLIGGYHFARYDLNQGTAGAAAEAGWYWQKANPYIKKDGYYLMPMLDLENITISGTTYNPGHWNYTKTTFSQWANSYCTTLSNYAYAAGVIIRPVIYTSSSFGNSWLDSTVTKWIPWIAAWNGQSAQTGGPSGTGPWPTWNVWQYTDAASVSGISGNVDGDVFNGTAVGLATTLVIGGGAPGITNQPLSQTVMVGSNVGFTVGAKGSTPLAYQWRLNGASIPGATLSTYIRYNAQLTNAGTYTVTVTNAYGTTNSANAVLTVHGPPVITAQPTNVVTGLGLTASFSVAVSGSPPLAYQWSLNGGSLAGATTNSLTIIHMDATNAGTYTVVVTNLYGKATSSNALLTVMDPYITTQPQSLTVAPGAPARFEVGAIGTAPLAYWWARNGVVLANGTNISGQGTPTLNLASVQVGDVGTYSVTVSNVNGTVASSGARLLAPYRPDIVTQPVGQTVPAGSTVELSVSVLGPEPLSYQWRQGTNNLVDGADFSGAATASLTITNIQAGGMGLFSVVVTNDYGSAISSNALVSVWPLLAWGAGTSNSGAIQSFGQSIVPVGLGGVAAVAGGLYHSLALLTNGTVTAWGAGQTNKGTLPYLGQAIVPPGLTNVVEVAAGYYHNLAVLPEGTLTAWGAGTTNTGFDAHYGQAMVPESLSNVTDVAAGGYHSLAVKGDGTVAAWGAGTTAIGSGVEFGQSIVPGGLSDVVAVSAGAYHSLALSLDGTVSAWGAGSTNTGSTPNYGQAMVPAGLSNAVMIAAGGFHSLALKSDGAVVAWGDNTYGQTHAPADLSNVVAIAAGRYNTLALKSDGTLVGWGAGVTNLGTTPNWGQSIVPALLTHAIAVSAGGFHTLVLEGDGSPVFTVQPRNQTVSAGANVTFTAMAVGDQPLSYQWQLNGAGIPAATSSSLSLPAAQSGGYSIVVSNSAGAVTSAVAALTVLLPNPMLVAPSFTPTDGFRVNLVGAPGNNYVIEGSSNLADWIPLETNTSPFTFSDPNAVNLPLRFYRARLLP